MDEWALRASSFAPAPRVKFCENYKKAFGRDYKLRCPACIHMQKRSNTHIVVHIRTLWILWKHWNHPVHAEKIMWSAVSLLENGEQRYITRSIIIYIYISSKQWVYFQGPCDPVYVEDVTLFRVGGTGTRSSPYLLPCNKMHQSVPEIVYGMLFCSEIRVSVLQGSFKGTNPLIICSEWFSNGSKKIKKK